MYDRAALGVRLHQREPHLPDDVAHEDRVEPHVRVERGGVAFGDLLVSGPDREPIEEAHRRAVTPLGGLLDRGLEAVAQVEHDRRVEDLVDLLRRELEIVRFGARRGEVRHRDPVAPDALRGVRHGVERTDDVHRRRGGTHRGDGHHRGPEHGDDHDHDLPPHRLNRSRQ